MGGERHASSGKLSGTLLHVRLVTTSVLRTRRRRRRRRAQRPKTRRFLLEFSARSAALPDETAKEC